MVPQDGLAPSSRASRTRILLLNDWEVDEARSAQMAQPRAPRGVRSAGAHEVGSATSKVELRAGCAPASPRYKGGTSLPYAYGAKHGRRGRTRTSTKHSSSATPAIRRVVLLYTTRRRNGRRPRGRTAHACVSGRCLHWLTRRRIMKWSGRQDLPFRQAQGPERSRGTPAITRARGERVGCYTTSGIWPHSLRPGN